MQARTALIAALACGGLAAVLVAADVAWSIEARIDSHIDGQWITVAAIGHDPYARGHPALYTCAGPALRVTVDNDRPIPANGLPVRISYTNASSPRETLALSERWDLDAFAERTHTLTIPPEAFPSENATDDNPRPLAPYERSVYLQVQIGDQYLSTSVCTEAAP